MRTAALFLLISLAGITGLCGQERIDSRQEALMHYQQGKDFYSLGRYREATSEFEKALDLIGPPRLEFEAATREQAQKAITPETAPKIEIKKPAQAPQEPAAEGAGSAEEQEHPEKEYYIDPGDVLDISVWQIPDLSKPEVIVRPDGKISFPLIGDLKAESLTLTQLDASITEKLKAYVKAPEVSVMIKRFGEQANKIVVLGEIFLPGVYKFGGPPSITEVVASAGGYTKYAVLNSIMVIRGDVRTRPEVLRVNFARIIKGSRLRENIFLKPNDIVYVPKSFIGNVNTFLEIFQPAINEYLQTLNARHLQHVVHSKGGV
ncbi:MAG: polysaccharide biosynthesis/export family protein [Candidatus Omnitrophica bacterium]|nr:polysaccharide biosynthesis/export family protein [Candidatus Omnitrophota bacterium]